MQQPHYQLVVQTYVLNYYVHASTNTKQDSKLTLNDKLDRNNILVTYNT